MPMKAVRILDIQVEGPVFRLPVPIEPVPLIVVPIPHGDVLPVDVSLIGQSLET